MSNSVSSVRERAIALLGKGVPATVVASHLGVSDGAISQLIEDEGVKTAIAVQRAGDLEEALTIDGAVRELESYALKQLKRQLPTARNAIETAKVFQVLNNAKRKIAGINDNGGSDSDGTATVSIVLPKAARNVFIQVNASNQVVEVEGRSMAALPSRNLAKLVGGSKAQTLDVSTIEAKPAAPQLPPLANGQHREAISSEQRLLDEKRAADVLAAMQDVEVMIGGVRRVI